MSEPVWIKDDVVLAIHRRQLAEHGGGEGMRDSGLLESALNKPKNLYHYRNPEPDLALLAASYAYGIAKNHPFVDGNKRTAFVVCRLFLKLNGTDLTATQEEKYNIFLKLAAGDLSEQELADWITRFLL
ncbi:Death on curing protein, Doc toxin [hydrothermal vent metagenome]|uniref:Death on curing protein, Doc toxin n=1 Tax=hydrothermal vent metagenome TaxID=652676 RepID=A0A3B1AWW1_9ZZZZ